MFPNDRRSPWGERFFQAFASSDRPLAFDDLASLVVGKGARLSDIATWIAQCQRSGLIEPVPFTPGRDGRPDGPRRFRITDEGLRRAGRNRRTDSERIEVAA